VLGFTARGRGAVFGFTARRTKWQDATPMLDLPSGWFVAALSAAVALDG
jgi:hypothetical protein